MGTTSSGRDRRSFQDLQRMAGTPAPSSARDGRPSQPPSGVIRSAEGADHDSGVIDLALAQAADPHAAERAATTPLAAAGLFDEDPASERGSQPPPVSQRISVPAPSSSLSGGAHSGSMPIASASQPSVDARDATPVRAVVPAPVEAEKKRGSGGMMFGGLMAAAAVAAGAFFFVQQNKGNAVVAQVETPVMQPVVEAKWVGARLELLGTVLMRVFSDKYISGKFSVAIGEVLMFGQRNQHRTRRVVVAQ